MDIYVFAQDYREVVKLPFLKIVQVSDEKKSGLTFHGILVV